ncbi:glutathione S-transferase-like protein [Mycena rosella]|uniref:glutathione transferase n=1 Tax=Mycena rosella TaxID=1033263 RepID=A0AAD7FEM1_MYCRO|nr:glutathione S-transferase-like protein [Mycena rosella]
MVILKLYGAGYTSCTRRVATVLHELKVPFELIEIDVKKGEQKTPAYLEKQPFGKIPYIADDGFILYESRAICRYIAAKHPAAGFIPSEPKAHAICEQMTSAEFASFEPLVALILRETFFKPMMLGTTADLTVVEEPLAILENLAAYDVILGKQRYLAGDVLTLADLFHLPHVPYLAAGGSDIMTRKPNVARWYNELIARPYFLVYEGGVKTTTAY